MLSLVEKWIPKKTVNERLLRSFDPQIFRQKRPYPWHGFDGFLTRDGFEKLRLDFPPLELFEKHEGIPRLYGQRPHGRYYLAYKPPTKKKTPPAAIRLQQGLALSWKRFIHELDTSLIYHAFIRRLVGIERYRVRYAWHIGTAGSEVSPHFDSDNKYATHIFYFNTPQDWKKEWGGSLLVLSGKRTQSLHPDFDDFKEAVQVDTLGNKSFLFQNGLSAWHGVRPLSCPEGYGRRVFNVIFVPLSEEDKFFKVPHP